MIMKKRLLLLLTILTLLFTASCGKAEDGQTGEAASQQNLSERIAKEISDAGEREKEVEKQQAEASTQPEMNKTAEEMYRLWDDTLNIVWKLLEAELDSGAMEALRAEEREWIAIKDAEVEAAGQAAAGGSLQAMDQSQKAAELTRERVYELAEYAQ